METEVKKFIWTHWWGANRNVYVMYWDNELHTFWPISLKVGSQFRVDNPWKNE